MKKRIFVEKEEPYLEIVKQNYCIDKKIEVTEVENGIILPAEIKCKNSLEGVYAGGVCDKDFNFIAGINRGKGISNLTVLDSYIVEKEDIKYSDEEIIFGGVLFGHFGHCFLEALSRLWYIIKYPDKRNLKIAFLVYNRQKKIPNWTYELLSLLKISREQVIIITEPCQYKKIIVPNESIYAHEAYYKEYITIYDEIRKNVTPKKVEKLYLTRTKLENCYDVNEKFYEEFYQKRGYEVIAPEQHTIKEQIEYIAGAKEIVCSIGTLSHLALFAKNRTRVIMLNRVNSFIVKPQILINHARKLDYYIIDATLQILPICHAHGNCLFYPTKYFKEFLKRENIPYDEEELKVEKEKVIYEYLLAWTRKYSEITSYKTIASLEPFDFVNSLSKELLNKELSQNDFFNETNNIVAKNIYINKCKKLEIEYNNLLKKYNDLNVKYSKIINSKSWKVTKPLRKAKKIIKM